MWHCPFKSTDSTNLESRRNLEFPTKKIVVMKVQIWSNQVKGKEEEEKEGGKKSLADLIKSTVGKLKGQLW